MSLNLKETLAAPTRSMGTAFVTSRWAEMSQPEHQKRNKLHQDSECPLPGRRCGLNESTSHRKNDLCIAYQREDSYPERIENSPYSRREKHTAQYSPGGRYEETGGQLKSVAKQDTHVSPSEISACTCWNGCSEKSILSSAGEDGGQLTIRGCGWGRMLGRPLGKSSWTVCSRLNVPPPQDPALYPPGKRSLRLSQDVLANVHSKLLDQSHRQGTPDVCGAQGQVPPWGSAVQPRGGRKSQLERGGTST